MSIKHPLFYNWQEILHLWFWCICDCKVFIMIVKYLWLWCICDCEVFEILMHLWLWYQSKARACWLSDCWRKGYLFQSQCTCAMLMLVHMYDCVYMNAVMCTCAHVHMHMHMCIHERCHVYMCTCAYAYAYMCIHERCHVNTKACVNGIWGWWWNSILAIWLPSVVYLYNQENIYFIACRCIMYILISENWNGMGYLWIYDWYVFPVKEQIHGSAKYS